MNPHYRSILQESLVRQMEQLIAQAGKLRADGKLETARKLLPRIERLAAELEDLKPSGKVDR